MYNQRRLKKNGRAEDWSQLFPRKSTIPISIPFPNLLLLLLRRFGHVWLCATPQTAAHQAPPSLWLSRQENWSGLPFPFPMHASMLSRFSRVQLCAALWTAAHQAPLSIWFSRQEYWSRLPFPSPVPKPIIHQLSERAEFLQERTLQCRGSEYSCNVLSFSLRSMTFTQVSAYWGVVGRIVPLTPKCLHPNS